MNIASLVITCISVLIAFSSFVFCVKNFNKTDKKDIISDAREMATLNVKLDNISSNVTDIKYDISATKKDVTNLAVKVAEIEQSLKSAHKRLSEVEERIER